MSNEQEKHYKDKTGVSSLHLTPTHLKMILDPKEVDGKDLAKQAFFELLANDLLKIEALEAPGKGRLAMTTVRYYFLRHTDKLRDFNPLPHQKVILDCYRPDQPIELKYFFYNVYKYAGYYKGFKDKYVYKPLRKMEIFEKHSPVLNSIFGEKYKLTELGLEIQKTVKKVLHSAEELLVNWIKQDFPRADSFLHHYGSWLLLSSKYDLKAYINLHRLMVSEKYASERAEDVENLFDWETDWADIIKGQILNPAFATSIGRIKDSHFEPEYFEFLDSEEDV